MQHKRFYATQLMKLFFQALMYATLFVSYFGMMAIGNSALVNLSRTAAITMATFAGSMVLLTAVYGGYDIDNRKKASVMANLVLTTLFTDVITYLILQIMNTNPNNPEANATFIFWSKNLGLMAGAFVVQAGLIYLFTTLGFRCYYRINPVQKCCIITSTQEMANHVAFHRIYCILA